MEELLSRLEKNGAKIPKYVREAEELSEYAWKARYPGYGDSVTRREYKHAVRIATGVVRWAERKVGQP